LNSKIFAEECKAYWEATKFNSPNSVITAYTEVHGLFHFQDDAASQQVSSSKLYALLRGVYPNSVNSDDLDLSLYLIIHGRQPIIDLHASKKTKDDKGPTIPYSRVSDVIADDQVVKRLKDLISSKSNSNSVVVNISDFAGKTIFYALRSARVREEPEYNGLKALCVVGYITLDSSGMGDGEVFRYFGDDTFQENGDLRTIDPIFLNTKSMLAFEYRLSRTHLPDRPEDRLGFVKVSPNKNREPIFQDGRAFKGTYRDFDPAGVSEEGTVHLEVVDVNDQIENELKRQADQFNLAFN